MGWLGFEMSKLPLPASCAADYGTKVGYPVCCGQKGVVGNEDSICPQAVPQCIGFVQGQKMGSCSSTSGEYNDPLIDSERLLEEALASYLGQGNVPCYRGPELYSAYSAVVLAPVWSIWVAHYKKYRHILMRDVVHVRRPSGDNFEAVMHPSSRDQQVEFTWGVSLVHPKHAMAYPTSNYRASSRRSQYPTECDYGCQIVRMGRSAKSLIT